MNIWDTRFIQLAELVASWSKDPDTQVGAVLVSPDRRQIAIGYNGFPKGFKDDYEIDKQLKLELTVHAELNVLHNADVSTVGWTMYVTKSPCNRCAVSIIQEGIARIVAPKISPLSSWENPQKRAVELFNTANIQIESY